MSQEGTTQGDPLAMAMYAIALIERISNSDVKQSWYADDVAAGGILSGLRKWWDDLVSTGPDYGYFPNAKKTHLLVKDHLVAEATELFKDTGIQVCTEGIRYLGAAIGKTSFLKSFMRGEADTWVCEIKTLSKVALDQPQAAYAAFTHGVRSYLMRTMPDIEMEFTTLEGAIRLEFIPALTGQNHLSDVQRNLLALPARTGVLV